MAKAANRENEKRRNKVVGASVGARIALKQLQFKGHWFRAEKWYTRATQLICFIFAVCFDCFVSLAHTLGHFSLTRWRRTRPILMPCIYNIPFNLSVFLLVASHLDHYYIFSSSSLLATADTRALDLMQRCECKTYTHTIESKVEKQLPSRAKITWIAQWQYAYNITQKMVTPIMVKTSERIQ